MNNIENKRFDQERSLYGITNTNVINCIFDGPSDGESAIKECSNIHLEYCKFNLRYPMWHVDKLNISHCVCNEGCRAAIWYSKCIDAKYSVFHGPKLFRECSDVKINNCDIVSEECGWYSDNLFIKDTNISGSYFALNTSNIQAQCLKLRSKYSLQYICNSSFKDCLIEGRDALWHANNVILENCILKGEYLGWYSNNLVLINCKIEGSQPLCYCRGLTIIDCICENCNLSFERSDIKASIKGFIDSIKEPLAGNIIVGSVGEVVGTSNNCDIIIICDEKN